MTWRQLDGGKRTFERAEQLIIFAQECGMTLEDFGTQAVQRMLETMLSLGQGHFQGLAQRRNEILLEDLWRCLLRLHGGRLDRIPRLTRDSFLRFQCDLARRSGNSRVHQERTKRSIAVLQNFLSIEGGLDVGDIAGDILQLRNPNDKTEVWVERLHILGRALTNGLDIPFGALVSILARALHAFDRNGVDQPDQLLTTTIEDVCSSIYGRHAGETSTKLRWHAQHCLQRYVRRTALGSSFGALEKGEQMLRNPSAAAPSIIKQSIAIISSIHLDSELRTAEKRPRIVASLDTSHPIDVAISLFERVAHRPFVDVHVLVAMSVRVLLDLARNPDTEKSAIAPIVRFTQILVSADLLPHIDDHLVHLTFDLLASASPHSELAYRLSRSVYARARAMQDCYKWSASPASDTRWRTMYRLALTREGPKHLHFASRLYADRLSDGRPIFRQDVLLFIRAIGASESTSKYVLLERHLKDYLYFGYGNIQGFAIAMVKGLAAAGRGRDAWLGFHLARRILVDKPFPGDIFSIVLRALSRSQDEEDLQRVEEVLVYAPEELRRELFDLVLCSIQAEIDPQISPETREYSSRLATMISLYTNMARQNFKPTESTVYAMIQALARSRHVSHAMRIVQAMLDNGTPLPMDIISLVIRRLEEEERFAEAETLKARYHTVQAVGGSSDPIGLWEIRARTLLREGRKDRFYSADLTKSIEAIRSAKSDLEYAALVDNSVNVDKMDRLVSRLQGALDIAKSSSELRDEVDGMELVTDIGKFLAEDEIAAELNTELPVAIDSKAPAQAQTSFGATDPRTLQATTDTEPTEGAGISFPR